MSRRFSRAAIPAALLLAAQAPAPASPSGTGRTVHTSPSGPAGAQLPPLHLPLSKGPLTVHTAPTGGATVPPPPTLPADAAGRPAPVPQDSPLPD